VEVAFHAMCVKGYVHSLSCTGPSTFQISDPSLSEGGGDRIWGSHFVLIRLSTNIYKASHTVISHGSHIRDSDPCKNIPTSFMDLYLTFMMLFLYHKGSLRG
jgi:hypothetical protein